MASSVALKLPIPTIAVVGAESDALVSGSVALTLTAPKLASALAIVGAVNLALPIPTIVTRDIAPTALQMPVPVLAMQGLTGLAGSVALHPPLLNLAATGVTGTLGTVELTSPLPKLSVVTSNTAALSMPRAQLSIGGQAGVVGSVILQPPSLVLALAASIPFTGTVAMSSTRQMAVVGATGNVASTAMTLRSLALAIRGYSGAVGNASMALPIVDLSITGEILITGNIVLAVPMLVLQATGGNPAGVNALTSSTIVMHTESSALTTYDNFKFNSFATFNGVYLGANDNGIFALSGATDDGAAINAMAQVGITDFGSSHLSRIDRCYVGYRTDGNLILRVFTEEKTSRDYLMQATGRSGLHGNHVRIGKGLAARYWSYAILNQNGAYFDLDAIELKPTALKRRVGGGDA